MRNGNVYPRPSSEPPTSGTGFGYWERPATPGRKPGPPDQILAAVRVLEYGWDALPAKRFEFWPTPTRSDARNRGVPSQLLRQYIPLSCRVRILPDGRFDTRPGRTNPEFTEWLMGWPMGWTALEPLATGRFRSWLLGHS